MSIQAISPSPWLKSATNSNIKLYPDDIIIERGLDGTIDPRLTDDVLQEGLYRYSQTAFVAFSGIDEALKELPDKEERIKGSKGIQYNTTKKLIDTLISPPEEYYRIEPTHFNRMPEVQIPHSHKHTPPIFSLGYAPSGKYIQYGKLILAKPIEPNSFETVCDRFYTLKKGCEDQVELYIPEGQDVDNQFFVVINDSILLHGAEGSISEDPGHPNKRRIGFVTSQILPKSYQNKELEAKHKYKFINSALDH